MKGEDYQRPNFPATWARMHGKGRVFYTSMGHREDVWTNPIFQNLLAGATILGVRTGRRRRVAEPEREVAPEGTQLPNYTETKKK